MSRLVSAQVQGVLATSVYPSLQQMAADVVVPLQEQFARMAADAVVPLQKQFAQQFALQLIPTQAIADQYGAMTRQIAESVRLSGIDWTALQTMVQAVASAGVEVAVAPDPTAEGDTVGDTAEVIDLPPGLSRADVVRLGAFLVALALAFVMSVPEARNGDLTGSIKDFFTVGSVLMVLGESYIRGDDL